MLLVGNRYVTLMAVTGDAKLVPTQLVKSLPLIWGWGTCRWNLQVPDP